MSIPCLPEVLRRCTQNPSLTHIQCIQELSQGTFILTSFDSANVAVPLHEAGIAFPSTNRYQWKQNLSPYETNLETVVATVFCFLPVPRNQITFPFRACVFDAFHVLVLLAMEWGPALLVRSNVDRKSCVLPPALL